MSHQISHITKRIIILLSILAVGLFSLPISGYADLSGTYTIGEGRNYTSISSAVTSLTSQGVSGPVIFNISENMTYDEQIVIGPITSPSSTNTITFQSGPAIGSSATVQFTPTAADNYVIRLNGADYVSFKNLIINSYGNNTYGIIVRLESDADLNEFLNIIFNGISTTSSGNTPALIISENSSVDYIRIEENTFKNGASGIVMRGVNSSNLSSGTQILNNTFNNQSWGAPYLLYQNAPQLIGNTVSGAGQRGFKLQSCDNGLQILKNKVSVNSSYGLYFYYCDGGTGLPFPRGLVANNFLAVTGTYGLYSYDNTYQDILYNGVNLSQGSTASAAFIIDGTGSTVNVQNNIFANSVGGYAASISGTPAINTSDYNNLYSPGNYLARWGTTNLIDLARLQSASSQDAHSVTDSYQKVMKMMLMK